MMTTNQEQFDEMKQKTLEMMTEQKDMKQYQLVIHNEKVGLHQDFTDDQRFALTRSPSLLQGDGKRTTVQNDLDQAEHNSKYLLQPESYDIQEVNKIGGAFGRRVNQRMMDNIDMLYASNNNASQFKDQRQQKRYRSQQPTKNQKRTKMQLQMNSGAVWDS